MACWYCLLPDCFTLQKASGGTKTFLIYLISNHSNLCKKIHSNTTWELQVIFSEGEKGSAHNVAFQAHRTSTITGSHSNVFTTLSIKKKKKFKQTCNSQCSMNLALTRCNRAHEETFNVITRIPCTAKHPLIANRGRGKSQNYHNESWECTGSRVAKGQTYFLIQHQ